MIFESRTCWQGHNAGNEYAGGGEGESEKATEHIYSYTDRHVHTRHTRKKCRKNVNKGFVELKNNVRDYSILAAEKKHFFDANSWVT